MAVLISDKVKFRAKKTVRGTEGPCIMIKGSRHQEIIKILNMHAPKHRAIKYIKQNLIEPKEERDNSTIIMGDVKALSPQLREQRHSKSARVQKN